MTKISRATLREERSKQTRQRIYDTSISLFEKHGFDHVKIKDICEAADVSVGSFYHFYPSKEHILLAYSEASDEYFKELSSHLEETSPVQMLLDLVQLKIDFLAQSGVATCQKTFIANLNHHDGNALDISHKAYATFLDVIQKGIDGHIFKSDVDAGKITELMRFLISGLLTHWCLENGEFDVYQEADKQMKYLLELILEPKSI